MLSLSRPFPAFMSSTQATRLSSVSESFLRFFSRGNTETEFDESLGQELLTRIDFLEQLQEIDGTHAERIVSSAGMLVGFLHHLTNSIKATAEGEFEVFAKALRPNFLEAMFRHRRAFILRVPLPDTPEIVVDWAEFTLFKLSETILHFCGPPSLEYECKRFHWSEIIEFKMSPRKYTCAASQLPSTWSEVHAFLDLTCISEAAKRLSIYLLFGTYMLSPFSKKSRAKENDDLEIFKNSLYKHLKNMESNNVCGDYTTDALHLQKHIFKSHCSLLLVIFFSFDLGIENTRSTQNTSFHPSVTNAVMSIVGHILLGEREQFLIEALTEEQFCLFRWNNFIVWCWKTWETELHWHERILQITATWLYHFATTYSDLDGLFASRSSGCTGGEVILTLIDLLSSSATNQSVRTVLFKASWAFCYLYEKERASFNDMLLQKAFQVFFRLQIISGDDILDQSIRDLAFHFTVETGSEYVFFADNVMEIVKDIVQRVKDICFGSDDAMLPIYLNMLILVTHHNREKISLIMDNIILSRLASLVEDSSTSTSIHIQLNAFLLLSYLAKNDDASYCHLLSNVLARTQSYDFSYAAVLATCVYNIAPILFKLDSCVLLELWYYFVDAFLAYSSLSLMQDLSPTFHTIICALSQIMSHTSLAHDLAWLSSPWTAVLHHILLLETHWPGGCALVQQLSEAITTSGAEISKHVFAQRLKVIYIRGDAQLIGCIE